jgi:DNA-binding CsgD family transcriptional regulator
MTTVGLVRQYGSLLVANSAECLIKAGRMDEADELLASGLRQHPRGLQGAAVLEQCARLALVRGDLDLAFDRLGQARLRLDDEGAPDSWLRETWELTAELELWEGRPQAAYEAVSEGLRLLGDDEDRWLGGQLAVLGLRAVADEAAPGASGATSDRHAVRQRRDHIYGAVESLLGQESPTVEYAALDATGRAEMGRLDPQGDVAARWVDAREQWERLGRPFFAAYCGWREAEARLAAGDRSGAVAPLWAARGVAVALGSARLLDELDALARWYKVESFLSPEDAGGAEPTEDAAEAALAELGLTPREQEVLAALAAGRTNGEIADELFISVKTASVHVSNILKKLDVSGRQEAARVAHRLGLRS